VTVSSGIPPSSRRFFSLPVLVLLPPAAPRLAVPPEALARDPPERVGDEHRHPGVGLLDDRPDQGLERLPRDDFGQGDRRRAPHLPGAVRERVRERLGIALPRGEREGEGDPLPDPVLVVGEEVEAQLRPQGLVRHPGQGLRGLAAQVPVLQGEGVPQHGERPGVVRVQDPERLRLALQVLSLQLFAVAIQDLVVAVLLGG